MTPAHGGHVQKWEQLKETCADGVLASRTSPWEPISSEGPGIRHGTDTGPWASEVARRAPHCPLLVGPPGWSDLVGRLLLSPLPQVCYSHVNFHLFWERPSGALKGAPRGGAGVPGWPSCLCLFTGHPVREVCSHPFHCLELQGCPRVPCLSPKATVFLGMCRGC